MLKNYRIRDYNFRLIIWIIVLSIIGLLSIQSAKESLLDRQLMGVIAGVFFMILISLFDYKIFLKFYWLIYIINILLLLFVQIFGDSSGGAQRWVTLFGIKFQPSETCKIMLILFFAQLIMKCKDKMHKVSMLIGLIILFAIPLYLVFIQPDLSTSIVIGLIFIALIYVGGLSYKIIVPILIVTLPTLLILYNMVLQPDQKLLSDYQRNRILAWRNPEEYRYSLGFQQSNSMMAIGSGQLHGKGLDNNVITSVKNGGFVIKPETDFIFSIIGEELGFIGAAVTLALILCIVFECLIIAYKANDLEGKILASGVAALIAFQSFVHIAVTVGVFPNTGLPLPFVSYGLTSLVSCFIGMGFVINIGLQCKRNR